MIILFFLEIELISKNNKLILPITTILLIAQCATTPYLADNESYFIQTIKWLNEFGLIKGLVNLHVFFVQTSGWHICQSVFNFSFIYNNFIDLSGFCLLIGNVFVFQKLDLYFKYSNKNNLIIGLFPIFNLLFFRFISAPSPDIPVYVFSFNVFYFFLMNFKNVTNENLKLITILVLFILFIKTTSVAIVFMPLVLFYNNYKKLKPTILPIVFLPFLVLYIIKNVIVTAYPFYPLAYFGFINLDYALPIKMLDFLTTATKADAYWLSSVKYQQMTIFQLIKIWFTATIIDLIFNGLTLIILVFSPFFIYKYKNEKAVWGLYFIAVIQMIIMFLTSPQYRYFIHFILIFVLIILSSFLYNQKVIFSFIILSNLAINMVLFIPLNFKSVAKNEFISKNNTFSFDNIIFPEANSNSISKYNVIKNGNLKYNSPVEKTFFGEVAMANYQQSINYNKLF